MSKAAPRPGRARVLLVDDHAVVRQGIGYLLEQSGVFEVCGQAADRARALEALQACAPDLAVVDISLGREDGLDCVRALTEARPSLAVLVLSMHEEDLYAARALRAGARGYVMKTAPAEAIVAAARTVLEGKPALSPAVEERLRDQALTRPGKPSGLEALSARELSVFRLLGAGLGPSRIAQDLALSVKTVESYLAQIKQKLGAADAEELRRRAVAWGRSGGPAGGTGGASRGQA